MRKKDTALNKSKKKWSIEKIDVDQNELDLVTNLITNDEFAKAVVPAIDISLFEIDFVRQVLKWCVDHYKEYEKAPKKTIQKIYEKASDNGLDEGTADEIAGYLEHLSSKWEAVESDIDVDYEINRSLENLSGLHIKRHTSQVRDLLRQGKTKEAQAECESFVNPVRDAGKKKPSIEDVTLDLDEFISLKISKVRMLINPWISTESIILISGEKGIGKTLFTMWIVDCLTKDIDPLPWEIEHQCQVLYLDGEMPESIMHARWKKLNPGFERDKAIFFYSDYRASRAGKTRVNLSDKCWRDEMKEYLINNKIKLFVIDNISACAPGIDENSKQDWDPINQYLLELRSSGITTILIHHLGKNLKAGPRGTSARSDQIDVSLILKRRRDVTCSGDDDLHLIVEFDKGRNIVGGGTSVSLTMDKDFNWSYGDLQQERDYEILQMLDEGIKQKDIAAHIGLSEMSITNIKRKLISNGLLDKNKKLTDFGRSKIA